MTDLSAIADEVARSLATATSDGRGGYIRTPLRYPGGSCVVVMISGDGDRFFVTDMGFGMSEAEQIGAEGQYARIAPEIARRRGLSFDQHSFFLVECNRLQLVGAVGLVANCSKEAVDLAALRLAEKRHSEVESAFFDRLEKVFGKTHVSRDVTIQGAHKRDWEVDALVSHDGKVVAFDFVKPSPQSAYPVIAKFLDLALLPDPPRRVAVVRKFTDMKPFVGLISEAGGAVMQTDATDRALIAA